MDLTVGTHQVEQITPVPLAEPAPEPIAGLSWIKCPDTVEQQRCILLFERLTQA